MANPVFENALATIAQAMGSVETEIQRCAGIHQQTEALQGQQKELRQTVAGLAEQVRQHREELAGAAANVKQLMDEGGKRKSQLIETAQKAALEVVAQGRKDAEQLIADAKKDAQQWIELAWDKKREHDELDQKLAALSEHVEEQKKLLDQLKKKAAAFAAM